MGLKLTKNPLPPLSEKQFVQLTEDEVSAHVLEHGPNAFRGPARKATFNAAVDGILDTCREISDTRGVEYRDSWALENQVTLFQDSTFEMLDHTPAKYAPSRWKRLNTMASMIDVKLSRLAGEYKADTYIDLINYIAAYAGLRAEYEAPTTNT